MAEAPLLSTKNNNNNISPQPWELGLSQRQSGGGELVVLVLLVVFECLVNVARHGSGPSVPLQWLSTHSRCPSARLVRRPTAERFVSDGVPSTRRPLLALI